MTLPPSACFPMETKNFPPLLLTLISFEFIGQFWLNLLRGNDIKDIIPVRVCQARQRTEFFLFERPFSKQQRIHGCTSFWRGEEEKGQEKCPNTRNSSGQALLIEANQALAGKFFGRHSTWNGKNQSPLSFHVHKKFQCQGKYGSEIVFDILSFSLGAEPSPACKAQCLGVHLAWLLSCFLAVHRHC